MPLSDELRGLLLKYIAGETDEEESRKVQEMLADNPLIFAEFEQLWDLWYAVGTATNVFRFNVDKGWESLLAKRSDFAGEKPHKGTVKRMLLWASAAAVLLLAGFFLWKNEGLNQDARNRLVLRSQDSVITRQPDKSAPEKNSMTRITTKGGERKRVVLPDGSRVWLNGHSELTFASYTHARILVLSGEGFFDVTHDSKKPFIVKTAHATIRALGTRFDVAAYPKDMVTDAILTSGSILFTAEVRHHTIVRQLVPGDKVSINYLSNDLKISRVDTAFYISWRDGRLFFQGQKFRDIAKAMGRKYDVSFRFQDSALAEKRLNGYLDKESLSEALEALQLTLLFKYRITDSVVVIYQ